MLEEVAAEVGLDDFGDPSFRDGLDQLDVLGHRRRRRLNPIGQAVFEGQVKGALANRLRVVDWHRAAPGRRPRGGGSADRHRRAPPHGHDRAEPPPRMRSGRTGRSSGWEAGNSVPPPHARRVRHATRASRRRESATACSTCVNPGFKAIHYDPPDEPFECVVILAQHFHSAMLPDDVHHSRLRRVDARRRRAGRRTGTTARCCRCCSRSARGAGSSKTPHHGLVDRRGRRHVSRCALRRHPPRPGEGGGVGAEPGRLVERHVHRRRPPRVHRRRTGHG